VEAIEANDIAGLCALFEEAAVWRRQLREAA
jgi:hypothetical protein